MLGVAGIVAGCSGGGDKAPATSCNEVETDLRPLYEAGRTEVAGAAGLAGTWRATQAWLEKQLVQHDEWMALGWCSYRADRVDEAEDIFRIAQGRVRHSSDAALGLGYVAMRKKQNGDAVRSFTLALDYAPESADAAEGFKEALQRLPIGDPAAKPALDVARKFSRKRPGDRFGLYLVTLAERRTGGSGEMRLRKDTGGPEPRYFARAGNDYLEILGADGKWTPQFVKGVNLGPARPGFFASEAPEDEATWTDWLTRIAGLDANSIRVYTLLPPAFYKALVKHNQSPGARRLWLLQGVWADLPAGDNFDDPAYLEAFHKEIARVVDAVHGDLIFAPERGNARGVYDTDASSYTLGWIVGREWEPYAVATYESLRPGSCSHAGEFVKVTAARPMECWIARTLDYTAAYEARRHGAARPLSFANWPTLDPLVHPTEATRDEENVLRHKIKGDPLATYSGPAWDDDGATVDASVMAGTQRFPAGVFASYHIYPNFPYFMNLDPGYARVRDEDGINRYAGYLRDLKAHHGKQPVLVAEFGMSTSRGIAHLQPDGLHHGGQDEATAMRQTARLLRSISRERMAGGVVFEFMDEWFKGTWSTNPFAIPEDNRPRWFNAESPEQAYGLFANRPVAPVRVDGSAAEWSKQPVLAKARAAGTGWNSLQSLRATYDAGWVYLLIQTAGRGPVDWNALALSIGLDTYADDRGERQLPLPAACEARTGMEFAVVLRGPGASELLVTPPYKVRHPASSNASLVLVSPLQPTGRFDRPSLETNRERFGRDGTRFAPEQVHPGQLRFGSLDPASQVFDTRTDVAVGADGTIELRLPWGLLNFADPSTTQVLHNPAPAPQFGMQATDRIRLTVCATNPALGVGTNQLPPAALKLKPWGEPAVVLEPKHGLQALRDAMTAINDVPAQ